MYRQGDVLLVEESVTVLGEAIPPREGQNVLAEGEATGHAHTIDARMATMYRTAAGIVLLAVVKEALLKHQEHQEINIPPGTYRVVRQREYSPEEIHNVAD